MARSWRATASRFCSRAPTAALAITAPSSWMVLITPEATPASSGRRSRVAMLKTGPHMKPMPSPLTTRPGTNAHRLESACAAHAMYADPAASMSSPELTRYLGFTRCPAGPLATPEVRNIAAGCTATVSPAAIALSPRTDW